MVVGDVFMILATIAWSIYSWLLTQPKDPAEIRRNWAAFLLAQVMFGVVWSGAFAAGEWLVSPDCRSSGAYLWRRHSSM